MKQINNWSDFKDYCSSLPNTKAVGDEFEKLTKHYLKYDPKYATKLNKALADPDKALRELIGEGKPKEKEVSGISNNTV